MFNILIHYRYLFYILYRNNFTIIMIFFLCVRVCVCVCVCGGGGGGGTWKLAATRCNIAHVVYS